MKKIESRAHPAVKRLSALRGQAKAREAQKRLIVVGKECLDDLGEAFGFKKEQKPTLKVKSLFSTDKAHLSRLEAPSVEKLLVSVDVWQKISGLTSKEGFGVELEYPETFFDIEAPFPSELLKVSPKVLVLDAIADPGNMGTLLRSAWAFGYHTVCLTPGCAHPFNDKALRSAKGISLKLSLIQCSIEKLTQELKEADRATFAAHMSGNKLHSSVALKGKRTLIVGNEARGVNPALLDISKSIAIEMEPGIDSLNAAVAGSLLMWRL